jgi:hypothetical protein
MLHTAARPATSPTPHWLPCDMRKPSDELHDAAGLAPLACAAPAARLHAVGQSCAVLSPHVGFHTLITATCKALWMIRVHRIVMAVLSLRLVHAAALPFPLQAHFLLEIVMETRNVAAEPDS